jgi:predicted NUDIX family NTP pyrophosphohydrolase
MAKISAGILIYRKRKNRIEVLLLHPGGPFWKNKDDGAWTISKGELNEGEEPLKAAIRELKEETGISISKPPTPLMSVMQPSGKLVHAWAIELDVDASLVKSDLFEMEWPPHSGKKAKFPEIDKADWFTFQDAKVKIMKGQFPFLEELSKKY